MSDFIIENGTLKKYVGKNKIVEIPEGVIEIGEKVFTRKGIHEVIMPNSVLSIGYDAFCNCDKLTKVTFSNNLEKIGPNAFHSCSLETISLPQSLKMIDSFAFGYCVNLKKVQMSETVKLGIGCFSGCVSLADENGFCIVNNTLYGYENTSNVLEIPKGVQRIDLHILSFNNSNEFERFVIPSSVCEIETQVFDDRNKSNFKRLKECIISCVPNDKTQAEKWIKNLNCFEGFVSAYLQNGFYANELIEKALVKQIISKNNRIFFMNDAIYRSEEIKVAKLLSCVKKLSLDELDSYLVITKDTSIRALLMNYKNKYYTNIEVESNQTVQEEKALGIREMTLADYRKIFKITKKEGKYIITGYKVEDEEVVVPSRINGISVDLGERVFQDNEYVTKIIIEEGVEKIGAFAFSNCKKLKDVYVPESVKEFGSYNSAFYTQTPFTLHVKAESKTEELAKTRKIPFIVE